MPARLYLPLTALGNQHTKSPATVLRTAGLDEASTMQNPLQLAVLHRPRLSTLIIDHWKGREVVSLINPATTGLARTEYPVPTAVKRAVNLA